MKVLKIIPGIFKYIFVATILVVSLIPIIWVLMSSFKTNIEILNSAFSLPHKIQIKNYVNAFKMSPMARFYVNSIIVAGFGTLLNIIVLAMAAYVCARLEFKAKNIVFLLFSTSMLIPASVLLYPLYLIINKMGLYDNLGGLILVYAGLGIPTTLYILRSFFLTIPKELEEAAYLDGSGFLRTFLWIMLPISKPGIATAGILQFLLCWNEFQFALVLTTGTESRTLPLALAYFTGLYSSDYGALFAATIIIIIPTIIIYTIFQEQVVSGLAAGAVKG